MTDTKPQPLADGQMERLRSLAAEGNGAARDILNALEAERAARLAAEARVAELEKLVYVPGLWRCAKCNFILVQSNLNAANGTVTARDDPGDTCPNCDANLWRVSERQERQEMQVAHEKEFEQRIAAEAERDRLREAIRPQPAQSMKSDRRRSRQSRRISGGWDDMAAA